MSDRLTPVRVLVQVGSVLAVFAVVGALCGVLWFKIWSPPPGVVAAKQWFPDPVEAGLRADFSGTGLYVLIALVGGLVVGGLTAYFFDRSELATLAAVIVGSALAGWLMLRVGTHLGPANPEVLAKTAADGTELPGHLHVSGLPARCAFPAGALIALSGVYLLTRPRGRPTERVNAGTRG